MVTVSCLPLAVSRSQAWGSALLAGVLSFASPKESSQRKGDPKVGALRVPCATRQAGRLAKLACGSDNASRLPPAFLRCSAPLMGTPKASALNRCAPRIDFHGQPEKTAKNEILRRRFHAQIQSLPRKRESRTVDSHLRGNDGTHAQTRIVSPGPLRGAEQRRKAGGSRRGLFEGRSPEFRSRPAFRVAQGTGAAGTDPGSPFLCLLSFGEAKESETPRKGGTPSQSGTPCQLSGTKP